MRAFILRQNIARFKALLEQEARETDRLILAELLARALREQAIPASQCEGLRTDIDLTRAAAQRLIFRNMTSSARIAGCPPFDVFPDNPEDATTDGVSNLFASLKRVVERGIVDAMPIQRYDIRNRKAYS